MRILLQKLCLISLFGILAFQISNAQSTNQATPTAVVSNEISGTIRARAIGDSRLTNYFYAFNGTQGDVFINIVTKNFDGDIDIFTIDGLKPLTKITIFSDYSDNETGRIIYLRKSEKLLLRIQGGSPNEENATFRIKFAGSFEPLPLRAADEIKRPETNIRNQGEVLVNSVGTIIGVVPKPTPDPASKDKSDSEQEDSPEETIPGKEIIVKSVEESPAVESSARIEIRKGAVEDVADISNPEDPEVSKEEPVILKPVVVVTENSFPTESEADVKKEDSVKPEDKAVLPDPQKIDVPKINEEPKPEIEPPAKTVEPMKPEQLQKIELVVKFKDGKTISLPMNKVFSFNVNQGILTIVSDDGQVSRYSLLDVEKISIE